MQRRRAEETGGWGEKVESKMGQDVTGRKYVNISRVCGMCETDRLNVRCVLVP